MRNTTKKLQADAQGAYASTFAHETGSSNEIWKKIPNLQHYEASNYGRIRSVDHYYKKRFYKGRVLKETFDNWGYLRITANNKTLKSHRLVAYTFLPNPQNLPDINHKNGIKTDNRPINLEWCTQRWNNEHAIKIGLVLPLSAYDHSKLEYEEKVEISDRYSRRKIKKCSLRSLAKEYGVHYETIGRIVNKTRRDAI
jgi:hypothetical protein